MRCYVVLFDPGVAEDFIARALSLQETSGLPGELIGSKIDTTNGHQFGIYITEETAKRFPQFLTEFNGEWLDCP